MFELLFLAMGISALIKKNKLSKIDRNRYSHVDEKQFAKWTDMKFVALNKTLISVGAYIVCAIVIAIIFPNIMGPYFFIPYLINLIFWVGYQEHFHRKVNNLSKELNIVWP